MALYPKGGKVLFLLSFGRNCVWGTFVGMGLPATKKRNKPTQRQNIIDLFEGRIGDHELSASDQEYFARVKSCYRSQINFNSRKKTIKMLVATFEISEATAQRLYTDTEAIYGSTRKFNKEFARHKAEEMALATFRKAKMANAPKIMAQAVGAYIRASGIEQENSDLPDFDQLEPGDVIVMLPDSIREAIETMITGGSVDLNKANYTVESEVIDITPPADASTESAR